MTSRIGRAARKRIFELAAALGIIINARRSCSKQSEWNGVDQAGRDVNGKLFSNRDLVHAIAHWLCATPARRLKPDYGLGTGPESERATKRRVTDESAYTEELATCILCVAIEEKLGVARTEAGGWGYCTRGESVFDAYGIHSLGVERINTLRKFLERRRVASALESVGFELSDEIARVLEACTSRGSPLSRSGVDY